MKTIVLSLIVFSASIFLNGCNTVTHTAGGAVIGVAKDTGGVYGALKRADKWFEDRYW